MFLNSDPLLLIVEVLDMVTTRGAARLSVQGVAAAVLGNSVVDVLLVAQLVDDVKVRFIIVKVTTAVGAVRVGIVIEGTATIAGHHLGVDWIFVSERCIE